MSAEARRFTTDRLAVGPWHDRIDHRHPELDLPRFVVDLLTEPVTLHLPDDWRGPYSVQRAKAWIADRDAEGRTLLAVDHRCDEPIGLIMLFESPGIDGLIDLRLGYLLAESSWGNGFATELVGGLVRWCRGQPKIASLTGGVSPNNRPSIRVLDRLGFVALGDNDDADDELVYRLSLDDRSHEY